MSRGGFTLVELMVAGAVGVIVLSAGTLVVLGVSQQYGQARRLAEMRGQAQLVLEQLQTELQQAGLGAPRGFRVNGSLERFPPAILGASGTSLAFFADLPRPDSNFNGVSTVSDTTSLVVGGAGLSLLNELNGDCTPYLADLPCATNTSSLIFGLTTPTCGSADTSPSCPWALNRYRTGEVVIVTNLVGGWAEATIDTSSLDATTGILRYLKLASPLPAGMWTPVTGGQLSTPDRIYYQVTATQELQRNQCWGTVGSPASADVLATNPCVQGEITGTGWETLASGVTQFTLTPLDAVGNAIAVPVSDADLPRVADLRVALTLQRPGTTQPLTFSEQTDCALRSWSVP